MGNVQPENAKTAAGPTCTPSNAEEDFNRQDENLRTTSFVTTKPGEVQVMTRQYKIITSGVLWFCYFSLALNDYIFGPTFSDLSAILNVNFQKISYFAVLRQFAYTFGSLGGVAFNYVNRQLALMTLLLVGGLSLFLTPYSPGLAMLYVMAVVNGFAAGACDVGFHVWILEMFQNGGGPLLQALHFSFGIGIAVAPLITASFLSDHSACDTSDHGDHLTPADIADKRFTLFAPYAIIGSVSIAGGLMLGGLFFYQKYIPPRELKLPVSFDKEMPRTLTRSDKLEAWKKSLPSFFVMLIIALGACFCFAYYGLEMTYFQFLAQFSAAPAINITGSAAANLEAATGSAYALGGFIAMIASLKFHPEHMIYVNFVIMNVGAIMLHFVTARFEKGKSESMFWVSNIIVGLGFSSCYATGYTFLEHQINVTNLIGSIFLFAGGLGTALFPLFLSTICASPQVLVYLALIAMNSALVLFVLMHAMTAMRGQQVKQIKTDLLKTSAANRPKDAKLN